MKITLTQFVTLDGVFQAPGAPEEDASSGFRTAAGPFLSGTTTSAPS